MRQLFAYLLDLILPRSRTIQLIEGLNYRKLLQLAPSKTTDRAKDNVSLFSYKNPLIKEAIWALKYRGNKKVAKLFSECIFHELQNEFYKKFIANPLIIPIPLFHKKERKRGFNQCAMLIEELEKLNVENSFETNCHILIKTRNTENQTEKNRTDRLNNLADCFNVLNTKAISQRNIILIDDVITTGSTLTEARNTLIKFGAKRVMAIALAH